MDFPRERFGYHVVYDRDLFDAISFAEAHGFGYVVPDLMIPRFWPERFSGSERRRIREYAQDHGVSISFHAPSDYLSLITPYPEVIEGILVRMKTCLDLAEDLEAERFTIHPSRPLNFASAGGEGTYLRDHWEFYKTILSEGITGVVEGASSVKVCLENDPLDRFVMEVVEDLLSAGLDLYLSWDIPKSLDPTKGEPKQVDSFFLRNIQRLKEAHLHDRRPGERYHDTLGSGDVDVAKYLRLLAPEDVHFTLEIRPREDAHRSLLYVEELWKSL